MFTVLFECIKNSFKSLAIALILILSFILSTSKKAKIDYDCDYHNGANVEIWDTKSGRLKELTGKGAKLPGDICIIPNGDVIMKNTRIKLDNLKKRLCGPKGYFSAFKSFTLKRDRLYISGFKNPGPISTYTFK